MRTTVTLTPEADAIVRRTMRERGLSFKDALNETIVRGGGISELREFRTPTFDLGRTLVPLDRAVALAGELEDEELVRKRDVGS